MSKDQVARLISFETEELWPHQKRETSRCYFRFSTSCGCGNLWPGVSSGTKCTATDRPGQDNSL